MTLDFKTTIRLFVICSVCALSALADVASDQAMIDRLVQQGKFDHAEMLCRERLQGDVAIEQRAAFTVELLRVLTEKARQSKLVEADEVFRTVQSVGKSFLANETDSSQRWLVEFQLALLPRLRGDLRQWQIGGVTGDALHLRYLRDSLKQLVSLGERMDVELRRASRGRPSKSELSAKELRELRGRVALEVGRTYRAQAESYAVNSDDRTLAASQGQSALERLSPTSLTPEWWWRGRMDLLACLRLKSDWAASARRFEVMLADRIPSGGKAELRAEAVRIALARQDWAKAKSLIASGMPRIDLTDAQMQSAFEDLSLAYVEAFLALALRAQQGGDPTAARDYQARAAEIVDGKRDASAYWIRRVESLLARSAGNGAGSAGGFPLTVRAARGLYRQGKLPEAAAAYRRAADQARASGDREEAFSLMSTAAGLLVTAKRTEEAVQLLREQSIANADLPSAAAAHLLAIKLQAPRSEVAGTAESRRNDYLSSLDEHVKWWPRGATADQVAWWRGRAREYAGLHAEALEDYLTISAGFVERAEAVTAMERCARRLLGEPDSIDSAGGVRRVVSRLWDVARDVEANDEVRDAAALSAVRIAMLAPDQSTKGAVSAELTQMLETLRERLRNRDATSSGWDVARMALAEGWFFVGRQDEAQREIDKVSSASAEQWLQMLQSASPAATASAVERRISAAWRLMLVDRAGNTTKSLGEPRQRLWERLTVLALADAGQVAAALAQIERLMKQLPKDAELRELHARLLTEAAGTPSVALAVDDAAALEAWRLVVAGSPPQSARWYGAKYELARLHLKRGDADRAAQMIELLKTLHPDLGGLEQKGRFLKLLKECRP